MLTVLTVDGQNPHQLRSVTYRITSTHTYVPVRSSMIMALLLFLFGSSSNSVKNYSSKLGKKFRNRFNFTSYGRTVQCAVL